MMKFLAITAFMDNGCPYRRRNIAACIAQMTKSFPEAEHLVIEQGTGEWFDSMEFSVTHRVMQIDGPFHKTALLNNAVRENPGYDAYVMVDADVYMCRGMAEYIMDNTADGKLVFPYGDTLYLDETDTRRLISTGTTWDGAKDHGIIMARQTGLCNAFTRGSFDAVGGYDDGFTGWGAEDDAFMFKFKRLGYAILRNPDKSVPARHMFHPKVNTAAYLASNSYMENRVKCACIRRMNDSDFKRYISGEAALDEMVAKYSAIGRLAVSLEWKLLPDVMLCMDTTIYDVDRSGEMNMETVLDAVLREDGPDGVTVFIDTVLRKIPGIERTSHMQVIDEWYSRWSNA